MACLSAGAVVLAATSAGVRHQLALSFTRQPASYVELFVASSSLRAAEGGGRAGVRVEVAVRPHEQDLHGQAVLLQVRRGDAVTTRRRVMSVDSGEDARLLLNAPLPRGTGPWTATVTLPGRDERLLLHGGGTSVPG